MNATSATVAAPLFHLPKVPSGIPGLDDVLHGGLPQGRTTLLSGGPGSGKTILALQMLYHRALAGEAGIFVSFEERADAVRENARALGWDLAALEAAGTLFLLEAPVSAEVVISGEFNLLGLLGILGGLAKQTGAQYIAIDALDALLRLFDDRRRERDELHNIHNWLAEARLTALITAKNSSPREEGHHDWLEFLADCVLLLDQRIDKQVITRRLQVLKYRGSGAGRNEYPYIIHAGGMRLVPLSSAQLNHLPLGAYQSSGHAGLDQLLGGGYRRGASVVIEGTSGTGKTTLACTFARSACERGEKVLYLSFEESADSLVEGMTSPGIPLRPALTQDCLRIVSLLPEARGIEEHLIFALDALEDFQPQHLILDSLTATVRMGSDKAAFEFLVRLISACRERGITTLLTSNARDTDDISDICSLEISSLVDTVIQLRYVRGGGEINRLLQVTKSRGSKHSNQYREFLITDQGMDLVDVYVSDEGVMTGLARQEREARDADNRRRRRHAIAQKEREIQERQSALQSQLALLQGELQKARAELESLRLEEEIDLSHQQLRDESRRESHSGRQSAPLAPTTPTEDRSRLGDEAK